MRVDRKTLLISILRGTGIALITGLVPRNNLIGATHYGWPIAWLVHLVLSPQHNPWRIMPIWFILDALIWSIFAFLLAYYL
jgi:hypothetical protein